MKTVVQADRFSFAHPTESKIWSFRRLRNGWHCGEGSEFSERELLEAIKLHSEIVGVGILKTNAFPGLSGEVRVTAYQEDSYAEFTLEKNGLWTFSLEKGEEEKDRKEFLSSDQIISIVNLLPKLCGLSGRSHVFTGTINGISLTAWPLSHPHRMGKFQFSRENVPSLALEAFADTQELSTDQLPASLQFFGSSAQNRFHPAPHCFHMMIPTQTSATGTSGDWIKKLQKTFSKQFQFQTFRSASTVCLEG